MKTSPEKRSHGAVTLKWGVYISLINKQVFLKSKCRIKNNQGAEGCLVISPGVDKQSIDLRVCRLYPQSQREKRLLQLHFSRNLQDFWILSTHKNKIIFGAMWHKDSLWKCWFSHFSTGICRKQSVEPICPQFLALKAWKLVNSPNVYSSVQNSTIGL